MPPETNSHHVERFTFVPISRAPNSTNRGNFSFFLGEICFKTQMLQVAVPVKLVNEGEPGLFAVIIDRGEIHEVIKPEFFFGERANLDDSLLVFDCQCQFSAKLDRSGDKLSKMFNEFVSQISGAHSFQGDYQAALVFGPYTGSFATTSFCNLIKPSNKASGRGGQPAT